MVNFKIYAVIGLVLVAVLTAAGWYALDAAYDRGVADTLATQAQDQQEENNRRQAEKERIETDAKKDLEVAKADADRARASADSLREQLARVKRLAENRSGAFADSGSAYNAVLLLADLLDQCSGKYREMAEFADTAHGNGKRCAAQYNSLRGK